MNGIHLKQLVVNKNKIMIKKSILFAVAITVLVSCKNQTETKEVKEVEPKEVTQTINEQVMAVSNQVNQLLKNNQLVANLDHHTMAKEEGVYTPSSIATIYSNPEMNTLLVKSNPLVGLDLPLKFLSYTEPDTTSVSLAYTSANFIAKRHGIDVAFLNDYNQEVQLVLNAMSSVQVSKTNVDSVSVGYGIIQLQSDFNFDQTVENLKNIVNAQSDTRWFGEVNYSQDAANLGEEINPTILLLFGGPAPGGKAMMTTPKIGLDAFCQKLLVYQNDNGEIWVAFNDIVAFSNLYYNRNTKPQNLINQRLTATFTKAIKKQ